MILHGIDDPSNIVRGNSLVRPLRDYTEDDRVHVIVTNPPFGGTEEDGIELGFPKKFQTRETADLFLVLIIHLLKENGRVGIVLPDGSLSGEGVKQRIREHLLNKCNLHTIIRLPNSVFKPYATVSTNLLFFSKGEPAKEVWYYEHQLPEGYKSYSKTKPIQLSEFDVIKKWWNNREEGPFSWKVDIKDIEEKGFNLDIKNPNIKRKKIEQSPEEIISEIRENQSQIDQLLSEIEELIKS
jgi:type I restriction enzyme M protein